MDGFFGKPIPQDDHRHDLSGRECENENSMLDWDWQASSQYGGQSLNLRDWLGRLVRDERQPRITTWTAGGEICHSCDNFDVKNAGHRVQSTFSERYAFWNKRTLIKDLDAAAEKGCKRCKVLKQALHYLDLPKVSDREVRLKFLPTSVAMFTEVPPRYIEIFPHDDEPSRTHGFPLATKNGRQRFGNATEPACLEEITMAINDCILNHHQCRPSANAARPNRLVIVPTENGLPVKIISAPPDAEYAALSHCWGTAPLKRLLKDDGNGEVTFAWQDLPPSYRDACTIARGLYMHYIWIDSLCIVQDDSDDWEREATKMGSIYESAYVTISATDAAASTHGFLFPRFTSEHFTAVDDENRLTRFTVRKYNLDGYNDKFPHYGDTPEHPWLLRASDMDKAYLNPLQLRGWCFQERLMSKRVLHVKRYEVVLECNMGFRCECSNMKTLSNKSVKSLVGLMMQESLSSSEVVRAERLRDLIYNETGGGSRLPLERVAANTDVRLMQAWEMLVEMYTRTSFTHQDDVLPALGSLAQLFRSFRPQWTYLGGLWLEQFQRSLMWVPQSPRGIDGTVAVRTKPSKPNAPPLGRVAPSFTWASLSGRIRYKAADFAGRTEFEVVSAAITPVGTNTYGDVASGLITLRGRAIAFRFWVEATERNSEINDATIQIDENSMDMPFCTQSKQHVEVCTNICVPTWKWRSTNKIESGMETLERVKGLDSSDEYSELFENRACSESRIGEEGQMLSDQFVPSHFPGLSTYVF